jgi:protein-tyrosine phosphatase
VDIEVQSAGLDAIEDFPVDPRALEIAQCWSISLAGHRARPVSTELLSAADVVFVMDHRNEAVFLSRYPHHAHKLVLLGRCSEDNEPAPTEIPDPFNGSAEDIRKSYERISDCMNVLTRHLAANRPVGVGA